MYVRGRRPSRDGLDLARETGMPILSTEYPMYKACGLLFSRGVRGIGDP
jgi:hypothetical protein